MKRLLTLGVFLLALVLTGCNINNTTESTTINQTTTTEQSTTTTEEVGDATLTGIEDVSIQIGATFEPTTGVTATDYDGTDLTSSIEVSGTVDEDTIGTYQLIYSVTGQSNNEVRQTRVVTVLSADPVIAVDPLVIDITIGDDLDLLIGVNATDDVDTDLAVTVSDNDGFDKDIIGTYTITYVAIDSDGNEATATRTVNVNEIKINYVIKVQNSFDANWGTDYLIVDEDNYITLTSDTDLGDPGNVTLYYNDSNLAITVSTTDKYGEAAIIDLHGTVKEGRDGANGKLVNADYPLRASGAQLDAQNYGVDMVIPAYGFLLLAPNSGEGFDVDGRSFIAKNVIYKYENVISIYLEDDSEILTQYIDRAPLFQNLVPLEVLQGTLVGDFNPTSGLKVMDDNGTFNISDDVEITLDNIIVLEAVNFDLNTPGTYIFMFAVEDSNGNIRNVQREIIINELTPTGPTIDINGNRFVLNQDLLNPTTIVATGINIFTPDFQGNLAELSVKWSLVVVLDENNQIILVRDPYGNQYTVDNPVAHAAVGWEAANMMAGLTNITAGYVLVFPNGSDSRQFGLDNARTIGQQIIFYNIYFQPTLEVNEKSFDFKEVNINPTTIDITSLNVFTSKYTGDITSFTLGYGVVVVLDHNGNVIITRDAANGKQIDVDHPNATLGLPAADAGWTSGNMLAGIIIPEGGLVLVFPNDGVNGATSPRTFALSNLRVYGLQVDFQLFNYQPSITASGNTINAIVNPETPTLNAMIFDSNYGTEIDFSLGYGVLVVVDANGKTVAVYDGANGKFWDETNTGVTGIVSSADYTLGVQIPVDGYVLIFPNDGVNGTDSPRTFGMALRGYNLPVEVNLGL